MGKLTFALKQMWLVTLPRRKNGRSNAAYRMSFYCRINWPLNLKPAATADTVAAVSSYFSSTEVQPVKGMEKREEEEEEEERACARVILKPCWFYSFSYSFT